MLAHYLTVLPHEFMNSFVAWAIGINSDPLDIHWGGRSPGNVLLLYNVDEKVDYKAAYAAGKAASVAAAVLLSVFIARTSLLLIPVIILVNWRRIVTRPGTPAAAVEAFS